MTFLWPNMLWFLAIVPMLILGYVLLLRRKRKIALKYASLAMVKDAMAAKPGFRRHVPPLLMLAAITVLLVAVARPAAVVTLPSERGTVVLAMDVSGSMRATDVKPTRYKAAQAAARTFVDEQSSHVRIGVVAFAASALVVQEPTQNRRDIVDAINRYSGQFGTNIGSGILMSLSSIFDDMEFELDTLYGWGEDAEQRRNRGGPGGGGGRGVPLGQQPDSNVPQDSFREREPGSFASAVIILLTDGQATTGPDPVEAARVAAKRGVRVFTVGVGTREGEILRFGGRSMRVQLDEESLKRIADVTRGEYFRATTATDLQEIYETLSTQLVMETEETEITAVFAALGAVLAIFAALLSFLWFNRIA